VSEEERKRLERIRRALLNLVAVDRDGHPDGRYTLDVRIIPREQPSQKSA
jgi:hypothetical protein